MAAVVFALLFPAVLRFRQAEDRASCMSNLRQLSIAVQSHHDAFNKLPPLAGGFALKDSPYYGTVFFHLVSFLGKNGVYPGAHGTEDGKEGFYVWANGTYSRPIRIFVCPADKTNPDAELLFRGWLATSSYAANAQVFGKSDPMTGEVTSLHNIATIPGSFPDGTSDTILFAERYQRCGANACAWGYYGDYYWLPAFAYYSSAKFQTAPAADVCDPTLAQTAHADGMSVLLADGTARTLASKINAQTYWALCTPAGGEVLETDY
jgi:hypothetical protein